MKKINKDKRNKGEKGETIRRNKKVRRNKIKKKILCA